MVKDAAKFTLIPVVSQQNESGVLRCELTVCQLCTGAEERVSTEVPASTERVDVSVTENPSGRQASPSGEGDWLERMRRRDEELQARIAQHDAEVYGRDT